MTSLDPTTLSPRQLEDLGAHDIHQLSVRAVNPLPPAARPLPARHASQPELPPVRLLLRHPLRQLDPRYARRLLGTAALEAARHQAQQDQLAQQRQTQALAELAERSARNIAPWNALRAAQVTSHQNLQIVQRDKPHWNNPRALQLTG